MNANYTAPTSLERAAPSFAKSKSFPPGQSQFTLIGGIGLSYHVEASSNLARWSPVMTNADPFDFIDNAVANSPLRF